VHVFLDWNLQHLVVVWCFQHFSDVQCPVTCPSPQVCLQINTLLHLLFAQVLGRVKVSAVAEQLVHGVDELAIANSAITIKGKRRDRLWFLHFADNQILFDQIENIVVNNHVRPFKPLVKRIIPNKLFEQDVILTQNLLPYGLVQDHQSGDYFLN
jgi:hypothetical protein